MTPGTWRTDRAGEELAIRAELSAETQCQTATALRPHPAHPTCTPSSVGPSAGDLTSLNLCTDRNQGLLRELRSYSQPVAQSLASMSCPAGFFLESLIQVTLSA